MLKNKRFFHALKAHFSGDSAPKVDQTPLHILVTGIFLVFIMGAYLTCTIIHSTVQNLEEAKLVQLEKIGRDYIDMATQKSLARASIIAQMPSIIEIFESGKREKLYSELKDLYADQVNKYGAGPAQFDIPPHNIFLRLHAPEKFGDDLSFRPMILEAMADQSPIKGISVGRSGPGLFGVAPIKNAKGKFLGVLEMSQSFDMLINTMKNAYGIESAVFFEEDILEKNATSINKDIFSSNNRFGSYVKLTSTNWDLISNLVTPGELHSSKPIEPYTKDYDDSHYGVVVIPLLNPAGTKLGALVMFSDLSINQKAARKLSIYVWLLSLVGAVLISGALYTVIKGGILRPLAQLSTRFSALAKDGPESQIPVDLHDYPGPVKPLAQSYLDLLKKKAGRD
jgi:methyl-accepting chemotaxis protein